MGVRTISKTFGPIMNGKIFDKVNFIRIYDKAQRMIYFPSRQFLVGGLKTLGMGKQIEIGFFMFGHDNVSLFYS